eukprot:14804248-Ditylum_brightwellii.AAC.1
MDGKAVVNDHFIFGEGWQLDCVAKRHGGSQQMCFPNGDTIPLEYDTTKYKLYVKCCTPTQKELRTVPIHWIDCHVEDLNIINGKKPVHRKSKEIAPTYTDPMQ